jgi:ParB family chromosome partitioning protein
VAVAAAAPAETAGVGHALHEVRTDTATRALVRALADDPTTALVALTARLFAVLVLRRGLAKGGGALTVSAEAYSRPRAPAIEVLDGEVRRRLADRRAAWETSGKTPIGWVAGLAHGDKMALLAELVALSLDLREERTTSLRRAARMEAAEIAALCAADVTLYWTPDEAFLRPHAKPQLLAMLESMGAGLERARALKKDELVGLVEEEAAARVWAPAWLSWAAPGEAADEDLAASDGPELEQPGETAGAAQPAGLDELAA